MYCKNCGLKIPTGDNVCHKCGEKIKKLDICNGYKGIVEAQLYNNQDNTICSASDTSAVNKSSSSDLSEKKYKIMIQRLKKRISKLKTIISILIIIILLLCIALTCIILKAKKDSDANNHDISTTSLENNDMEALTTEIDATQTDTTQMDATQTDAASPKQNEDIIEQKIEKKDSSSGKTEIKPDFDDDKNNDKYKEKTERGVY